VTAAAATAAAAAAAASSSSSSSCGGNSTMHKMQAPHLLPITTVPQLCIAYSPPPFSCPNPVPSTRIINS
jgi:hypothetical protein